MPKTLYIIDSHSHLYASFYAIPNLRAPSGEPTGATFGFTNAVLKILREKKPDYLVAVFDAPGELLRKETYADYKATRKPMPDDLRPQIDRVKEVLHALGVQTVMAPGFEADDIIARFAREGRHDGCQVIIVSRDKDLMQLLGPGVVMYDNRKDEVMDVDWLRREKSIAPGQVVDMLALMGDTSDNIPGVPGIGEKRAIALLEQYGSLESIIAHADEVKGKMGESLRANVDQARMSYELATLHADVPVELRYTDYTVGEPDRERLVALFRDLAFKGLVDQFDVADSAAGDGEKPSAKASADHKQDFRCVNTPEFLNALAKELASADAFAFDTEITGLDPLRDRLVGLSFSTASGQGAYIPVLAPEGETVLPLDAIRKALEPVLDDSDTLKIAHNAKFDIAVLRTAGLEVGGPIFDTMIAAYLIDPETRHGLDALAEELLGYTPVPITDLIGERKRGLPQKTMDEVPLDQITFYAAEDAEVAWRLYEVLRPKLQELGLADLFRDVEMPLVRVLERMERAGVSLDLDLLKQLSDKFGKRMEELRTEICAEAGHDFNVDSPKQLGVVLFDEIGLKPIKKTRGGSVSTDSDTLEALAPLHPLPAKVLEYRTFSKLKGTYVDALPQLVNPDTRRVHASFNQAVTATGRLSSSDPNLQNIPIRGELGRGIRAAFVPADPDRDVILSADYSQIELRLLAHFSQDPFLLDAFRRDLDIHAFVASEIFGVPQDQVTSEQRARAKAVNFSLIYGKTAFGLSRDLGISMGEARDFIDAYFARYTRVRDFMVEVLEGAKANGYVKTILDRRRPTPGVKFTDGRKWNNPERAAFNTVLQGSAADLIKVAMNNIDRRIRIDGHPSRMILQVHDELVFELPADAVDAESGMIVTEMTTALDLNVPMQVGVSSGPNWREAK